MKFEYIIYIKHTLHKFHMARAAAVASRRGATHVVFIWHMCYMIYVFEIQPV